MTGTIQLALTDQAKANALCLLLARSTQREVLCVDRPTVEQACVVVVDAATFGRLPVPLPCPDRVILIAPNDPDSLREAWEAGVHSVVSDNDPLNTLALAILAVCLRARDLPPAGAEARKPPLIGSSMKEIEP